MHIQCCGYAAACPQALVGWRWLATVSGVRTGELSVDVEAVSMLRSFFFKSAFQNDLQRRCWSGIWSAQVMQFVYLKLVYKIVVIVNAAYSVDKRGFFHNINGLRGRQLAGEPW